MATKKRKRIKRRRKVKRKPARQKKAITKTRPTRKKVAKKRTAVKQSAKAKVAGKPQAGEGVAVGVLRSIGEVTHYFPHVTAGVIKLTGSLKSGDMILIKGHTTNFKQKIVSMQIKHIPVKQARKGQEIGLKVLDRVRVGDAVYKLS